MSSSRPLPDPSASIADYLADREGLSGGARSTFLKLLAEAFGFRLRRPRWVVFTLSTWVGVVAALGFWSGWQRGAGWLFWLLWIVAISVGGSLVWALLRASPPRRRLGRELEWRAYCLLIRPIILAEQPGLLDRNRAQASRPTDEAGLSPQPVFADMLAGDRKANLWLPALIGWSVGSALPIIAHLVGAPTTWTLALPVGGTLLAPLIWGLFRMKTYIQVERIVRKESP